MKLYRGFNEKVYAGIAKRCGSAQLMRDISATNRLARLGSDIYAERIDEAALICGYFRKDGSLRIVGLGTTLESRGFGLAALLLQRAESETAKRGGQFMETLSKSGADYYARHGWEVLGCNAKNEYTLRKTIPNGE